MKKSSYVVIGKLGSTYGVQGWLKVQSYTEIADDVLNYSPWFLSKDEKTWKTIQVEQGRTHGKTIIVKLAGYDTPETARQLTGLLIATEREQLPQLKTDEYYWSDLEGLTVINQLGQSLGKISYLIETGANDVLVVKGEKEIAIPYLLGDVIIKIDLEEGNMYIKWDK